MTTDERNMARLLRWQPVLMQLPKASIKVNGIFNKHLISHTFYITKSTPNCDTFSQRCLNTVIWPVTKCYSHHVGYLTRAIRKILYCLVEFLTENVQFAAKCVKLRKSVRWSRKAHSNSKIYSTIAPHKAHLQHLLQSKKKWTEQKLLWYIKVSYGENVHT